MIEAPPDYVIEAARLAAIQSPCAKSKRGVVLFNPEQAERELRWHGAVDSTDRLTFRATHVIISSGFNGPPPPYECKNSMVCRGSCRDVCLHAEQRAIIAALGCDDVGDLELVHVKVIDGQVVAGGGPSCLQCSKLVAEVGIRGVWLFEAPSGLPYANPDATAPGVWRFYHANAFHEATLANNGIASLGAVE